jgi:hypothetical protein
VDATKIRWTVVEVGEHPDGWLLFTSEQTAPRRLSPIPTGWAQLPVKRLRRLLDRATSAPDALPGERAGFNPPSPHIDAVEAELLRERERRFLAEALLQGAERNVRALQAELDALRAAQRPSSPPPNGPVRTGATANGSPARA